MLAQVGNTMEKIRVIQLRHGDEEVIGQAFYLHSVSIVVERVGSKLDLGWKFFSVYLIRRST